MSIGLFVITITVATTISAALALLILAFFRGED